jgi:hypothetical protein
MAETKKSRTQSIAGSFLEGREVDKLGRYGLDEGTDLRFDTFFNHGIDAFFDPIIHENTFSNFRFYPRMATTRPRFFSHWTKHWRQHLASASVLGEPWIMALDLYYGSAFEFVMVLII